MKKSFVILAAAVLLLAGCSNGLANNPAENEENKLEQEKTEQTGTVTVNLNNSSRVISALYEWSMDDVKNWKVIFTGKTFERTESVSLTETNTYTLPVGDYDVTVEGTYTRDGKDYSIYGSSSVTIKKDTASSININVALKKEGKGSFEYTLKCGEGTADEVTFTSYLSPASGTGDAITLECTYSTEKEKDESGDTVEISYLNVTGSNIDSGYYYLHIFYDYSEAEDYSYEFTLEDNLIEIADGCCTTGDGEFNNDETVPVIYVTYDEDAKYKTYNGISSKYPEYIYKAMEDIGKLNSSVIEVVFFVVGSAPVDNNWNILPIDLSKNNATGKSINFQNHFYPAVIEADGAIGGSYYTSNDLQIYFTFTDSTSSNEKVAKFDVSGGFGQDEEDGNSYAPYITHSSSDISLTLLNTEGSSVTGAFVKLLLNSDELTSYTTPVWKIKDFGYEIYGAISCFACIEDKYVTGRYLYDTTGDTEKTIEIYIQPEIPNTSNKKDIITGTYNDEKIAGKTFFITSTSEKVILSTSAIGSTKWFTINEDICGDEILGTGSTLTLNLSDYKNDTDILCCSTDGTSYEYDSFSVKTALSGLFMDTTNDYFLYLSGDGGTLIKGRGLWMGDDQNQFAYLTANNLEVDNLTDDQRNVYNSMAEYAVFASDYNGCYKLEDNSLSDQDENSLYSYNPAALSFTSGTISLKLYDDTSMDYINSDDTISSITNSTVVYYRVNETGSTTVDSEAAASGSEFSDFQTAVKSVNLCSNGAILFIETDITAAEDTTGCGTDSLSYVEFEKTAYISGKNYNSGENYKINTSGPKLRVFSTNCSTNSAKVDVYTTNIELTGGDVNTGNGGVILLDGLYGSTYGFYDGTKINGGTADNGGGIYLYAESVSKATNIYCRGNVQITGNTANSNGGAIFANCNEVYTNIYDGTSISNNTASNGAGIYDAYGYLRLYGGTISGNKAIADGGGVYDQTSFTITLEDVKIENNTSGTGGDGIYVDTSALLSGLTTENVKDEVLYAVTVSSLSTKLAEFTNNTESAPVHIRAVKGTSEIALTDVLAALNANTSTYVYLNLNNSELETIGESAFLNSTTLTGIQLPASITAIGGTAFSGCTALKTITIPSAVASIGASAFYDCTSLTTVTFESDEVPTLESTLFENCTALNAIYVPTSTGVENYRSKLTEDVLSKEITPTLYANDESGLSVKLPETPSA